jgi:hypothetical protein
MKILLFYIYLGKLRLKNTKYFLSRSTFITKISPTETKTKERGQKVESHFVKNLEKPFHPNYIEKYQWQIRT